ncbi:MAG: restriction endonuclease-like protein, partial [Psychrosphaera sp.]|nr:restriction endonuclease-like protein [Psychrosphaera sp.]
MPELLVVKTQHFELVVWAKNIEPNRQKLKKTLQARGKSLPLASLRFNPAVKLKDDGNSCSEYPLPLPLFFENTQYSFELIFEEGVNTDKARQPRTEHTLVSVNSAFHFSNRREVPVLQGTLNFGNDIGMFSLPVKYYVENECHEVTIGCDVLPTKMDYHSDLDAINRTVDEYFPLWRFALAAKTEITTDSTRKQQQPFPLLWLAQLQYLLEDLEKAVKYIIKSPHSRLVNTTSLVKVDRIKRRLTTKLAERVNDDLKRKQYHRSYPVASKTLSTDTPENRFIKMVLNHTNNQLYKIAVVAKKHNTGLATPQLSTAFFDRIKAMQQSLIKYRNQPLFKEVGGFNGLNGDSSWIQQKNGYGQAWRIWCKLQLYLDVLGKHAAVSTKSIATLYEIWCFLEILCILESLGFKQQPSKRPKLKISGLTTKPIDEDSGTFHLDRGDGVTIRLVHEPKIKKGTTPERSWIGTQRPDILLEAQFADGEKLIWLFDAKYRVDSDKSDGADWVPMDAINQMHRYRDAIFHFDPSDSGNQKSRTVFGAFALY